MEPHALPRLFVAASLCWGALVVAQAAGVVHDAMDTRARISAQTVAALISAAIAGVAVALALLVAATVSGRRERHRQRSRVNRLPGEVMLLGMLPLNAFLQGVGLIVVVPGEPSRPSWWDCLGAVGFGFVVTLVLAAALDRLTHPILPAEPGRVQL